MSCLKDEVLQAMVAPRRNKYYYDSSTTHSLFQGLQQALSTVKRQNMIEGRPKKSPGFYRYLLPIPLVFPPVMQVCSYLGGCRFEQSFKHKSLQRQDKELGNGNSLQGNVILGGRLLAHQASPRPFLGNPLEAEGGVALQVHAQTPNSTPGLRSLGHRNPICCIPLCTKHGQHKSFVLLQSPIVSLCIQFM